jgi:uncharacterized protein
MNNFTPVSALVGGVLIGLSASLLLWVNDRIAGVSGVLGGLLPPRAGEKTWRLLFLAGLVLGAGGYLALTAVWQHPSGRAFRCPCCYWRAF